MPSRRGPARLGRRDPPPACQGRQRQASTAAAVALEPRLHRAGPTSPDRLRSPLDLNARLPSQASPAPNRSASCAACVASSRALRCGAAPASSASCRATRATRHAPAPASAPSRRRAARGLNIKLRSQPNDCWSPAPCLGPPWRQVPSPPPAWMPERFKKKLELLNTRAERDKEEKRLQARDPAPQPPGLGSSRSRAHLARSCAGAARPGGRGRGGLAAAAGGHLDLLGHLHRGRLRRGGRGRARRGALPR